MNGCDCREKRAEHGGSCCSTSCISGWIQSFCHLPKTTATSKPNCPNLHRQRIQPKYTLQTSPLPSPSGNPEQNSRFILISNQAANQSHQCELLQASRRLRRSPGLARLQCSHRWAAALAATQDSFGRERTSKLH